MNILHSIKKLNIAIIIAMLLIFLNIQLIFHNMSIWNKYSLIDVMEKQIMEITLENEGSIVSLNLFIFVVLTPFGHAPFAPRPGLQGTLCCWKTH